MASIELTAGMELLASMLSVSFLGAVLVIFWDYLRRFPHDRWQLRLLVYSMMTVACADTLMNCIAVFDMLIVHFGDEEYVNRRTWMLCAVFPSIGVSCSVLQSFLVYRIYIVSAKRWKLIPVLTMCLTLTGASISLYVAGWLATQEYASDLEKKVYLVWTWYACHAVSDVLTTSSLLYFLVYRPWKSGAGVARSITLTRVVRRGVETNSLSLIWQTVVMLTFASAAKIGFVYSILAFTLVKIYAFSLLSALNTRNSSLDEMDPYRSSGARGATSLGTTFKRATAFGPPSGGETNAVRRVQVTVVEDVDVDSYVDVDPYERKKIRELDAGEPVEVSLRENLRSREERVRDLGLPQDEY